jgi:hypothetical protein
MFPGLEGITPGEKTYHETRRCCCCSFLQDLVNGCAQEGEEDRVLLRWFISFFNGFVWA